MIRIYFDERLIFPFPFEIIWYSKVSVDIHELLGSFHVAWLETVSIVRMKYVPVDPHRSVYVFCPNNSILESGFNPKVVLLCYSSASDRYLTQDITPMREYERFLDPLGVAQDEFLCYALMQRRKSELPLTLKQRRNRCRTLKKLVGTL